MKKPPAIKKTKTNSQLSRLKEKQLLVQLLNKDLQIKAWSLSIQLPIAVAIGPPVPAVT